VTAPSKTQAALVSQKLAAFKIFLKARGADVLVATNEWELIRFRANNETSVIYSRKNGHVTFHNGSKAAWDAFVGNTSWRGTVATRRTSTALKTLMIRDNGVCFYCINDVHINDASEEHLLSATHGGPDNLANKVLAHKLCNSRAGHLDLFEKIKLHVNAVLEKAKYASPNT
jgi:5-methylcytosine-specific restriction endonuclease McrA